MSLFGEDDDRSACVGHSTCPLAADSQLFGNARILVTELTDAYERGWQPADLLHVTRRSSEAADADLAAAAVLCEARQSRAADRAPTEWVDQLRVIAERHPDAAIRAERIPFDGTDSHTVAEVLATGFPSYAGYQLTSLVLTWKYLPSWTILTPPPSAWPRHRAPSETTEKAADEGADPKMLNKIRGLLAKAEATEFAEEAETFTAKAQELMTRYAIGIVLLHPEGTDGTDVHSRRLHLDNPYVKEKAHLLTAIGDANRVRTVWFPKLAIATVIGSPLDLQQVDMLFTSLLVQATRAVQSAEAPGRSGSRTTSFRKAFLAGFASRIGERLREAETRATADAARAASMSVSDLLPILATTSKAVDAEFDRLFPATRTARARTVDADGWRAGQVAADDASLSAGDRTLRR